MTSNEILKAEMLDILFENRNKQYGAYTLRKYYNNRLGLSLAFALGLMFLIVLLIQTDGSHDTHIKNVREVVLTQLPIPKLIKPQLPTVPKNSISQKPAATQKFNQLTIVDDILVDNPLVSLSDLEKGVVASHTNDIPGSSGDTPDQNGNGGTKTDEAEKKEMPVPPMIQREPEFPGGMQAWLKYLNKHLNVPEELEAGEKKFVVISFKVAEDGSVTSFEVLQSAGNIYDNEVMRVLKKMPKWKPAIQNNQPVTRTFTQPVTFMGLSD